MSITAASRRCRSDLARGLSAVLMLLAALAPLGAQQEAKLVPSNAMPLAHFGSAVALSGDTLVVGTPDEQVPGPGSIGAAYVFTRTGTTWTQQARLVASPPVPLSRFGESVAIAGDTIVVGAPEDNHAGFASGSVYVFTRSGATWLQQARLFDAAAAAYDYFGWSVAVEDDTLLVGASDADAGSDAYAVGRVSVFTRSGTAWTPAATLSASDGAPFAYFGWSVALSGDTALIGALGHGGTLAADAGAAYVFVRSGSTWTEQAELSGLDADGGECQGASLALAGDTAVIGAACDDGAGGFATGSAYVFTRSGTAWSQQAKLTAGDGAPGDHFGNAVGVSGDVAIVGAAFDDLSSGADAGSAYVFVRSGATWSQQSQLGAADAAADELFGSGVAIDAQRAVVGKPRDDLGSGQQDGSAYVYKLSAWADLGSGLAGIAGVPKLAGTGSLVAGSAGAVTLSNAAPAAVALLVISSSSTPVPFKCGTLVPFPLMISFLLVTDAGGSLALPWNAWPPTVSATSLYWQYGIQDAAAPCGASLSNALRADVP